MDIKKLQEIIVDALDDIKARDIAVFDTTKGTAEFDRVVIATADVARQTKAMAMNVIDKVRAAGGRIVSMEGGESGEWVLVDCSDAIVHIMQPAARQHYNLEELWGQKKVKVLTASEKAAEVAAKAIEKAKAAKGAARAAVAKPAKKAAKAPAKTPARAAAKKAVKKAVPKVPARKVPAGKTPVRKAPVRKASAKKAVTRKAVARKTPVRKASAKKAAAKSVVKKSAAKKVAKKQ